MQFGIPLPDAFAGFIERLPLYLARIARLPIAWGIPGSEGAHGIPTRLFRYDHDRMKRMVLRSEHLIRCLIVWLAFLRLHYGKVEPGPPASPPRNNAHPPRRPIHHLFALRAIPLHKVDPPPFRVTLSEAGPSNTQHPRTSQRGSKPRYDDVLEGERLIQRADRLERLIDTLLPRADRLAAYWAGRLKRSQQGASPLGTDIPVSQREDRPPVCLIFDPLKSAQPPPDLMQDAEDDEAEDLSLLHDVAIDAAERFNALCG